MKNCLLEYLRLKSDFYELMKNYKIERGNQPENPLVRAKYNKKYQKYQKNLENIEKEYAKTSFFRLKNIIDEICSMMNCSRDEIKIKVRCADTFKVLNSDYDGAVKDALKCKKIKIDISHIDWRTALICRYDFEKEKLSNGSRFVDNCIIVDYEESGRAFLEMVGGSVGDLVIRLPLQYVASGESEFDRENDNIFEKNNSRILAKACQNIWLRNNVAEKSNRRVRDERN